MWVGQTICGSTNFMQRAMICSPVEFLLCVRFSACGFSHPWLRAWDKHLDLLFGQVKWSWGMVFLRPFRWKSNTRLFLLISLEVLAAGLLLIAFCIWFCILKSCKRKMTVICVYLSSPLSDVKETAVYQRVLMGEKPMTAHNLKTLILQPLKSCVSLLM